MKWWYQCCYSTSSLLVILAWLDTDLPWLVPLQWLVYTPLYGYSGNWHTICYRMSQDILFNIFLWYVTFAGHFGLSRYRFHMIDPLTMTGLHTLVWLFWQWKHFVTYPMKWGVRWPTGRALGLTSGKPHVWRWTWPYIEIGGERAVMSMLGSWCWRLQVRVQSSWHSGTQTLRPWRNLTQFRGYPGRSLQGAASHPCVYREMGKVFTGFLGEPDFYWFDWLKTATDYQPLVPRRKGMDFYSASNSPSWEVAVEGAVWSPVTHRLFFSNPKTQTPEINWLRQRITCSPWKSQWINKRPCVLILECQMQLLGWQPVSDP
jgi:hypothetical protein